MKKSLKFSIVLSGLVLSSSLFAQDINLNACTACHGIDWSKKALNNSKIVSEMSVEDIEASLKGYKDGTYGGTMKGLMKGQVVKYSEAELTEISKMIKKIE